MLGEIGTLVGIAVGLIGVGSGGYTLARSRNGYVKQSSCHQAMDHIDSQIESVKRDIVGVKTEIADLSGYIRGKLGE